MTRSQQTAFILFASGMIGMGILALIYGDFALVWQPVPAFPGHTALAYASGVLMVLCGIGLLIRRTTVWSIRILFPYLILWSSLKVPALFVAPQIEGVWLGIGELTTLLSGGWVLLALLSNLQESSILRFITGENGVRIARYLFAISIIPIGIAHIVYSKETADLVPAWLPYRLGWAYLTGYGQLACSLGVLFGVFPRVAAYSEAGMLSIFGLLVWLPKVIAGPTVRLSWTAFLITWAIASGAWVVAANLKTKQSVRGEKVSDEFSLANSQSTQSV